MADIRVNLNHAAIARFLRSPSGPVHREVSSVIRKTDAIATAKAPVDTGLLRNSRTSSVTDIGTAMVGRITYHADYATFVMKGTNGPITPKKGKFLVFRGRDGRLVFAKSVRGQKANPFLVEALKAASPWPVVVH